MPHIEMKKNYFQYHMKKPMLSDVLKMPIRCLREMFLFLMEAAESDYARFFKVKKSLFTLSEKGAREVTRSDLLRTLILNEFKTALWRQIQRDGGTNQTSSNNLIASAIAKFQTKL